MSVSFVLNHIKTITSESETKEVSTMPFIITNCQCKYKCHDDCIREWINNTSRCLLCNEAPVVTLLVLDEKTLIRGLNIIALSEPLLISDRSYFSTSSLSSWKTVSRFAIAEI